MKTISMRITIGREPVGQKLVLVLATFAAMAGIGYAFWCLLNVLQSWAASSALAAQIIQ